MADKKYLIDNEKLMKEWDWKKNQEWNYNPSQITLGSNKKTWWICPNGHSYDASVSNRNHGNSCPYCKGKKVLKGFNDLESWCKNNNRIDLINEFDKEKNDFTMQEITRGSGKEVWWMCPNGHSYKATLHHRINMNTGCGACSHKVFLEGYNDLLTTRPQIAKEFDSVKNHITPNKVMAGSNNKKYWFICPKGHSYKADLLFRKQGGNCPVCMKETHISFPEKCIVYYLSKLKIDIKENYHANFLGKKELDIFLPDYNIAIEYDGRAWHKNIKRDLEKDKACFENGIELIRIREKGCPVYESTSINFWVEVDKLDTLESAIEFVMNKINNSFFNDFKINIEDDRQKIYELLELNEKKNSLQDKCPQITLFWDNTKNGKLTPKQISFSSVKPIYLRCSENHQWVTTAHNFIKSPKCPICSGERVLPGYNDLGTTHPHLKKIWSIKNSKDISNFSYGSNSSAWWKCDTCGSEYEMRIIDKTTRNSGCPICSNHRLLVGYNDLATINPALAKEFCEEKNGGKTAKEFFPKSSKKVWWKCTKCGHEWMAQILKRNNGQGCPECYKKRIRINKDKGD